MLRFLFLFLFFFGSYFTPVSVLRSQSTAFSHQLFRVEEGLPSNITSCIFKDSRGLIWIGTEDKGLCIYDGSLFQPYPIEIGEGAEKDRLKNFMTRDICEDDIGRIWVATNKGVFIISLLENTIKFVQLSNNNQTIDCSVIFKANDGKMFVVTRTTREIIVIDQDLKIDATKYKAFNNIYKLVEDPYGNLWYSDIKKKGILYKIKKDNLDSSTVVLQLPSDFNFAKKENGDILLIHLINNKIQQLDPLGEKLIQYEDKEYQINDNTLKEVNKNFSGSNIYVSDQLFDSNGRIWLTTQLGLHYIQVYKRKLPFQNLPILSGKGLRLISKYGDVFYVSTTKGFYELDTKENILHLLHHSIDVTNILPFSNDSILLNVTGTNHFILDQKTKKVGEVIFKSKTPLDLLNTYFSIRHTDGQIFSGIYQLIGLDSIDYIKNCDQVLSFDTGIIYFFLLDLKNPDLIWIASEKGLYKMEGCQIIPVELEAGVEGFSLNTLYNWNEEELIIGATNSGIYHFHKQKGLLAEYNTLNGLSDNRVTCIQSNDNEGIWVATYNGLNYINLKEKTIQSFYEKDGLANNEFNRYSTYKTAEGDIWFGGVAGCTIIPKDLRLPEPVQYKLRINSYGKIDKVSQLFNRFFLGTKNQTVTLEPDEKYIEFHFGSSNFDNNKAMRYAFLLEGVDEDWIYSQNNNSARYTNLDAGSYRFRTKMKAANGDWQLSENWIDLEVQVYFYERRWFRGLMLFLFLLGAYSIAHYRSEQKRKVQQLKEKLARDLHDDVGSTLGGIHRIVYSLKKKQSVTKEDFDSNLDAIKKLSDSVVNNMKDVVWSIGGEKTTFGDLKNKIFDFSDDVLKGSEIKFTCTFEDIDTKQQLDFNSRYHLLMICKEGINNALKHNQGGKLDLLLKDENGYFFLILDNRFKQLRKAKISGSQGLKNMKERAKTLKASLDIETDEQYFRIVLKRGSFKK